MDFTSRRSRVAAVTLTAFAMFVAVIAAIAADRGTAEAAPAPATLSAALAMGQTSGGPIFAKFDGVDGDATDANHNKWIEIQSMRWGIAAPAADGSSRRRGDAELADIGMKFRYGKASPKIAEATLTGKVFPKLEIEFTTSFGGGQRPTYLRYELTNASVTSYDINGSGKKVPKNFVTVAFEEIKVTYTIFDDKGQSKGKVEYSWKVEEGEG